MSFLDLYFNETNDEFDNIHSRNNNTIYLLEDDSYIKLEFSNDGNNFIILEHSTEEFMYFLDDKYLIEELYNIIKNNYTTENWLFILFQVIFDLTYIRDYSSLTKFIKNHIYQESTSKSCQRNNINNEA
jgi:hypothetical protein